jgi:hypothetical protein
MDIHPIENSEAGLISMVADGWTRFQAQDCISLFFEVYHKDCFFNRAITQGSV